VDCSIQFPRRTSTWYCSLSVIALIRRNYDLVSRVAESEVKCPTPTPTFPKFPTPTPNSLAKHEWSLAVNNFAAISNQWKSWCTARILCCNKSFQRNCTISTGIPDLKVRCKKWFNWTSGGGVGQKNPTPTSSVLSNVKNDSIGLPEEESDKKIRLRLLVFLVTDSDCTQTPPTPSRPRIKHRLGNPAYQTFCLLG